MSHQMDPQSPWLKEFKLYLHSATSLPDGLTILQWWGQYPVWAYLARDYLSIMGSSVSSDIVEVIQVLHMLYNQDLMVHEPPPSSVLALDMEKEKNTFAIESTDAEDLSWILELSDDSDVEA
ncbi:hypothetical protein BS17DRAFT_765151 [Gyrodon lividus]|nr:hypothetical protein BS17DRAFT_765151 [Gyrodon lividus]